MDSEHKEQSTNRRHYSKDLKERVIYQYTVLGLQPAQIALNLDMSARVVHRTLQLWQEIGDVIRNPCTFNKRGRPMLLNDTACNVSFLHPFRMLFYTTSVAVYDEAA
jgi:transposase